MTGPVQGYGLDRRSILVRELRGMREIVVMSRKAAESSFSGLAMAYSNLSLAEEAVADYDSAELAARRAAAKAERPCSMEKLFTSGSLRSCTACKRLETRPYENYFCTGWPNEYHDTEHG